jgi:N utilization substance protein B
VIEPGDDDLISATDAARALGVDRKLIDFWENSRQLEVIRTLRGRMYRRSQLASLIEEHRRVEEALEETPEPVAAVEVAPTRSRARRTALELLHAADVAGTEPDVSSDVSTYARELVEGVLAHREEIDETIGARAEHWTIERMPVVDRNVLRIGVYELLHTDVPPGAVIDEAVRLARLLSTEDSGRFVNGLLARVARDGRPRTP